MGSVRTGQVEYGASIMHCIIVGAGEVGRHIADILSREGHDVVVVERDPERLRSVVDDFDVMGVAGNGAARRVLDAVSYTHLDVYKRQGQFFLVPIFTDMMLDIGWRHTLSLIHI